MFFTSFKFFLFFPVVVIIYYLIPQRYRWIWLSLASSVFYLAFSWKYLILLFGVILVNYVIGIKIYTSGGHLRKKLYVTGILLNILILCFFKYVNYLGIDFAKMAEFLHLNYPAQFINIILPLGLSYLIFTAISYLIDIKRQDIQPERHPGILASYFLFFPKLAQGPIERAGRVIPQFHEKHPFDYNVITGGLKLMAWGFFKKMVIADSLAVLVNAVYSNPLNSKGLVIVIGTVCFAFQLYADFSGYTDIALGSAQILGFDLMQNFRRPYLAKSVRDFWTRWHISLSSWCSDYVFLPIVEHTYDLKRKLRGIKFLHRLSAEKIMYVTAAFTTFIIIGIWHGVGWNYLIVGLLFGFYVSFDMLTKDIRKKINAKSGIEKHPLVFRNIQTITTFLLLCIPWMFFRANTINDAFVMIQNLFHGWSFHELRNSFVLLYHNGISERLIAIICLSTLLLIITDILSEKKDIFLRITEKPLLIRWTIYYILIIAIIVFSTAENKQFIYMQF